MVATLIAFHSAIECPHLWLINMRPNWFQSISLPSMTSNGNWPSWASSHSIRPRTTPPSCDLQSVVAVLEMFD
jgi:hypothetical protein